MGVRIGQYLLTPNTAFLFLALAYFVVLSYRRLRQIDASRSSRPVIVILFAIMSGVAGAWLHAEWLPVESMRFPLGWLDIRFGSFGGYWGVFLGAVLCARIVRMPAMASADAFVPGVLIGGAVARVGCLFTGCCRGIDVAAFGEFQPFRYWPLFDLLALLATAAVVTRTERKPGRQLASGLQVGLCLAVYGALRFILEFACGLPQILGPFTAAQVMATLQILVGLALLILLSPRRVRIDKGGA